MDEKNRKLLEELAAGGYKTAGELAERLNLSEKTIRTRIKDLGTMCNANGAVLRSKQRYGYCLELTDREQFLRFLEGIGSAGENTGFETPEQRTGYLLDILLNSPVYIKLDQLAETLFVSRQTLVHDLRKVEAVLDEYGISLEKRSKYGIRVMGQETAVRRCLVHQAVRKSSVKSGGGQHAGTGKLMLEILRDFRLEIAEPALLELFSYLDISLRRMNLGFFVRLPEDTGFIKERVEYEAAKTLYRKLSGMCAQAVPEDEILYLAVIMAGNRTRVGEQWEEQNFVIPQYLDELVERMLNTVYETFSLDFRYNLELRMALNYHMVSMDIRMRYQLPVRNTMLEEIRKNYLFAYTVACQAVIALKEYYQCEVSADETGYIALAFALAMEREKENVQKKRILMVCSSGNGSAQLLKYKYMEEFGKYIEEIRICTVYQLEDMDFSQIDYVLTTVPVKQKIPRPVMEIETFLGDSEILKIREKLQENEMDFLSEYYSSELFFTGLDGTCKEDVIKQMCGMIGKYRRLPKDFYDSVLKREDLAHTDYGNLVALPHPYKMMTDSTFVGVGILKKPIYWVQNQVQVVMLVSLAEGKHERTQEFYKVTTEFLLKEEAVLDLIADPRFENFMRLLKMR